MDEFPIYMYWASFYNLMHLQRFHCLPPLGSLGYVAPPQNILPSYGTVRTIYILKKRNFEMQNDAGQWERANFYICPTGKLMALKNK